jgi:hypothetical protein
MLSECVTGSIVLHLSFSGKSQSQTIVSSEGFAIASTCQPASCRLAEIPVSSDLTALQRTFIDRDIQERLRYDVPRVNNKNSVRELVGVFSQVSSAMRYAERLAIHGFFSCLIAAMGTAVGCGPASDRLPVSGSVTLDRAPLDDGTIRFTSKGGEKLIASGASIDHGEFQIPGDKGLPPGVYVLEISAADTNIPPGALTAPERIPAEYNSNSQKTIEVTVDGENHFDFDIVTKAR